MEGGWLLPDLPSQHFGCWGRAAASEVAAQILLAATQVAYPLKLESPWNSVRPVFAINSALTSRT